MVELVGKREFELRTLDTVFYHLRRIGSPAGETLSQLLHRRRLDEKAQCLVAIIFLDVAATLHVNVEHHILSFFELFLHLRLQCAIESIGIHLLVFQEFLVGDALSELLWSDEEVFHSVLLRSSWLSAGA